MRTPLSLLLLIIAMPAAAQTFPFVEDFSTGNANWAGNSAAVPLTPVASGGPLGAGDAYVTNTYNVATFMSPFGGPVVFRGQSNLGSSGGAYVGNWITAGVNEVTAMVRHNFTQPLSFSGRFAAPANSPGASTAGQLVEPNTWTQLAFDIGPTAFFEGSGDYSTFSSIGNIQLSISIPAGLTAADVGVVTFDLDAVTITAVPEPASVSLLALAACGGLAAWRRGRRV